MTSEEMLEVNKEVLLSEDVGLLRSALEAALKEIAYLSGREKTIFL